MTKTFILGVGAQKAGTSWLHRALQDCPGVDSGLAKEHHIWDHVYLPDERRVDPAPPQPDMSADMPQRRRDKLAKRAAAHALCARLREAPERYFDHFADVLARDGVGTAVDITPAYAGLPPEAYARIDRGFAAQGITLRVVFLMRDPVARIWSMARMNHSRGRAAAMIQNPDVTPYEALDIIYPTDRTRRRTRYDLTMAAIESALPADRIHYALYEEMFGDVGPGPLFAGLGLPDPSHLLKRQVNPGVGQAAPPHDQQVRVATAYREVYEACAARFPQTRDLWPGYALACPPRRPRGLGGLLRSLFGRT